ncbi:MAG: hypothetical protein GF355_11875, partial [Candidatus Eisenbacteria bacterium]|nr:hypothetical protein [Candidatus Eisenbacteria bacterium]
GAGRGSAVEEKETGERQQTWDDLLASIEISRHGRLAVLDMMERIVWQLESLQDTPTAPDKFKERIRSAAEGYEDFARPSLKRTLDLAEHLCVDPKIAIELSSAERSFSENMRGLLQTGLRHEAIAETIPELSSSASLAGKAFHRLRDEAFRKLSIDLKKTIQRVVDALAADIVRAGATVELNVAEDLQETHLRIERSSLTFILENLLSNALRAMAHGPEKRIEISALTEGNECIIRVRDSGCGLDTADWERIFTGNARSRPGGGQGLKASRRFLQAAGGTIAVAESRIGSGTTMEIRLPMIGSDDSAKREAVDVGETQNLDH